MKSALRALLILALTLPALSAPKPKAPPYFEGKHPVFVVVCAPALGCTGFYIDKSEAVRAHIPKCSATITNYCYR